VNEPTLLYDGNCGFCAASVQFILRHERRHTLRFAAIESGFGAAVRARHAELDGVDSMMWVQPSRDGQMETVFTRSTAVILAAGYLGGPWRLAWLARTLPPMPRDALYDVVARHRHRLFRSREQCYMPPPDALARFLS
jgi:predicted DCC family thiol-disulfide oxidoreductase YuxK